MISDEEMALLQEAAVVSTKYNLRDMTRSQEFGQEVSFNVQDGMKFTPRYKKLDDAVSKGIIIGNSRSSGWVLLVPGTGCAVTLPYLPRDARGVCKLPSLTKTPRNVAKFELDKLLKKFDNVDFFFSSLSQVLTKLDPANYCEGVLGEKCKYFGKKLSCPPSQCMIYELLRTPLYAIGFSKFTTDSPDMNAVELCSKYWSDESVRKILDAVSDEFTLQNPGYLVVPTPMAAGVALHETLNKSNISMASFSNKNQLSFLSRRYHLLVAGRPAWLSH